MTTEPTTLLTDVQHLVLENVTWEFYEMLLAQIGDGATRVTFDHGDIEIMSPLPKHERWGARIGRLLEVLAMERRFQIEGFGSTTFRSEPKQQGLEPDRCFYVQHAEAVRDMEEAFDPAVNPPPDLAIEIDITRRSVNREPIYAGLGVPELWRFDGRRLTVLLLSDKGAYAPSDVSVAFPFLPIVPFTSFVLKLAAEPQLAVLDEFRSWARSL